MAVASVETVEARVLDLTAACYFEAADPSAVATDAKSPLPRFRMVAYTGGPMRVGGWRYPVVVDLAGLAIPSQHRPIRFGHDAAHGVGHTDAIRVEAGQLIATGVVSRDTSAAKEVVSSSRNGFPWQASIGAGVEEFEFVKAEQKVIVNGRSFQGPLNVVRRATLGEISFVDLGADGSTSAQVAATQTSEIEQGDQQMQQQKEQNGQQGEGNETATNSASTAPVTATAVATTAAPSAPLPAPAPVSIGPMAAEQIRAEALAETSRIGSIRRLCAGRHPQIESRAIAEGWDPARTELEVLRAERPQIGAGVTVITHPEPARDPANAVLEAACALSARLEHPERHYDEQVLDAASKRFRGGGGIGLQELLLEAAWANGYTGRNFRDSRSVLRFAFSSDLQAGLSSIDLGGILSNVANKFLLEGFYSVERTWRNVCAVRNVSDFKTVTSYRLIGADTYEPVPPGGELKHGTLGNESYTNRADTFGIMLAIDRRDIINDDLGALTAVPRKLGRGSGLKINDVFWAAFLNNASFFTAGNKNLLAGADTVLGIDGLSKAEQAFMDQVDSDGKPIGIMPAVLLVPTALSAVSTQLYKSLEIRDTTASTRFPVANPHQGKFRAEVSRYLSNARYTGNSAKAWYLLADPNDLPVIEVAFLNGNESPTIETAEADFNVLGIQMRGFHDFGVSLQDPRGGVKSAGQ